MELNRLIASLSLPAAYPVPVEAIETRQTHISVVFLTAEHAYKIKKPVNLGFLDFSTLALRRHFCQEEVRLNARLAREVYLGVVPVVDAGGQLQFEAEGKPVEWAVKMKRLPDEAMLESRLAAGQVDAGLIGAVARRIAAFHAAAETSPRIASFGRFDVVAANARENFATARAHVGQSISPPVLDRLAALTEERLLTLHDRFESRAARGVPRDTHGDLRLDHVYVWNEKPQPRMLIVDCIEFNEQFRYADPVSDIAFLAMDLKFAGHHELAAALADAYFAAAHDDEGRSLMPFYVAYRAAVRGKVEGIKQAEREVSAPDRQHARQLARGYWLLALGELESPERRPALVLVAGLPGSGKSTLAASLAQQGGFEVIRSDAVRKELAAAADETAPQPFGTGIYAEAWNERTYAECLRRVETALFAARRVIVDASFRDDLRRRAFLDAAARWKVPAVLLVCQSAAEVIRGRLAARTGDLSDADWPVYVAAASRWEAPSPGVQSAWHVIDTGRTREQALAEAQSVLASLGLVR